MSMRRAARLSTAARSLQVCYEQPTAGPSRVRRLHTTHSHRAEEATTPQSTSLPPPSTPAVEQGTLPGSVHLFLTRKSTLPIWADWKEPSLVPIVSQLPPLPIIHDHALAQAAVDHTSTGLEMVERLALLGDAILSERAIHAIDQYGVAKTSGHLTRFKCPLTTNRTFSHLSLIYGLNRLILLHPIQQRIPQRALATTFEAWMAAAQIDAAMRGPQALANLDGILYRLFRFEAWEKLLEEAPEAYRRRDQHMPFSKLYGSIATPSCPRPDAAELASIVVSSDMDKLFQSPRPERQRGQSVAGVIFPTTLINTWSDLEDTFFRSQTVVTETVQLEGHPPHAIDVDSLRSSEDVQTILGKHLHLAKGVTGELPSSGKYFSKNLQPNVGRKPVEKKRRVKPKVVQPSKAALRRKRAAAAAAAAAKYKPSGPILGAIHAAKKMCAQALKLKIDGRKQSL